MSAHAFVCGVGCLCENGDGKFRLYEINAGFLLIRFREIPIDAIIILPVVDE
jgi:hypothetical protein